MWGILIAETLKQRTAAAAIGLADIAQVVARAAQLATTGRVLDAQGQIKPVSAATTRALLSATVGATEGRPAWSPEKLAYRLAGQQVDALTVKGAASSIALDSQAKIRVLADRLSAGTIEVQEWYQAMKVEVKTLHMAEASLARGGFAQMKAGQWARVEGIVATQYNGDTKFPGLRSFAEDIARGRYGNDALSSAVLQRGGMYAESGRATYENERVALGKENGYKEAKRLLGAADHCSSCVEWARLDWIPVDVMMEQYPIGAGVCGPKCGCAIILRKSGKAE